MLRSQTPNAEASLRRQPGEVAADTPSLLAGRVLPPLTREACFATLIFATVFASLSVRDKEARLHVRDHVRDGALKVTKAQRLPSLGFFDHFFPNIRSNESDV